MGMFDNIICKAPLPDGFNDKKYMDFQTKDLECELATYIITEDGRLTCSNSGAYGAVEKKELNYTGEICFCTSNWCGGGAGYVATDDDQPPWRRTYTAKFVDGKLIVINGGLEQESESQQQHVSREEFTRIVTRLVDEGYAKGAKEKHDQAMKLAAEAELDNDLKEKRHKFLEAGHLERQAGLWSNKEPSFSVLMRSAMSLFMSANSIGDTVSAFSDWRQMQRCCDDPPPQEIAAEIADILRQIADQITS